MKNDLILKYFSFERGVRQEGEKKGQPYFVAKFLDDENNKMVSFIVDQPLLQEKISKLTKYQDYDVSVEFNRTRYGNYELTLIDVN